MTGKTPLYYTNMASNKLAQINVDVKELKASVESNEYITSIEMIRRLDKIESSLVSCGEMLAKVIQ